jgi:hypothetical protein
MKKSMVFYYEWLPLINSLPNEKRLKFYDQIFSKEYNSNENDPHLKGIVDFVLSKKLDNEKKYEKKINANRENGKLGGRPRNPENPVGLPETQPNPNDNDNVNDNVNDKKENIKRKNFIPPSLSQVSEYMTKYTFEKGMRYELVQEPQKFLDFYQSKGWMVGKSKMKDWKAAARNWIRRANEFSSAKKEDVFDRGAIIPVPKLTEEQLTCQLDEDSLRKGEELMAKISGGGR